MELWFLGLTLDPTPDRRSLETSFADFIHKDINGKEILFDPILDSKYWPELMQLQDNITNLQAAAHKETGKTDIITFEDVCLNPLSDEMDPSAGGCTIFSGEL